MPLTQPGAASTTHAQRQRRTVRPRRPALKQAPVYDDKRHGGKLLWVFCAIECAINADILWELATRQSRLPKAHTSAMLAGFTQLNQESRECVRRVREAGQLLLCWEGTTVLEVPA